MVKYASKPQPTLTSKARLSSGAGAPTALSARQASSAPPAAATTRAPDGQGRAGSRRAASQP